MRARAAIVLGGATAAAPWAQSPLAAEVRALAGRYHEDPGRIELDPRFPPAYVLAGTVYYEVPGPFGGDLEKSANVADWTLKDSREARTLLDSLPGRS